VVLYIKLDRAGYYYNIVRNNWGVWGYTEYCWNYCTLTLCILIFFKPYKYGSTDKK